MISLLINVIIIGIIAYGITAMPIPNPFKIIAHCILAIILVVILANAAGYPVRLP